ncbi:MAG: TAXI family TRAP transporter solute-binding subunit [Sulfolobales archaeon]|nr:TAXI family TRAP transporter solute-binding subunit [Sulfolobales archaeon]
MSVQKSLVGVLVVLVIVAGVGGYFAGSSAVPPPRTVTSVVTQTVTTTAAAATVTVTSTITPPPQTVTSTVTLPPRTVTVTVTPTPTFPMPGWPKELIIRGWSPGTSGYLLMGVIGDLIDKNLGVKTTIQPGAGLTNLVAVGLGEVDIGLTLSLWPPIYLSGLAGRFGLAPTNMSNVAYLIGTYTPEFPILIYAHVNVPASTVPELMELIKGGKVKLVLGGPAKGVEEYFTRVLFGKYGIDFDALRLPTAGSAAAAEAFIEGKYDVVIDSDSLISTAWQTVDVRAGDKVKVILFTEEDLRYIINYFGGGAWERFKIPTKLYGFIREDYTTLSLYTTIVIRRDLPKDLVYHITKLLCEEREIIVGSIGAYENFNPSKGIVTSGLEIHPGAETYYREKGYIK